MILDTQISTILQVVVYKGKKVDHFLLQDVTEATKDVTQDHLTDVATDVVTDVVTDDAKPCAVLVVVRGYVTLLSGKLVVLLSPSVNMSQVKA